MSNIYLGIKYDAIYFLSPSKKEILRSYSYDDIDNVEPFPKSINIKIKSDNIEFIFKTGQSFEIS